MQVSPLLVNGESYPSEGTDAFCAYDPTTGKPLDVWYPISPWSEVEYAVKCAASAFEKVKTWPGERFALFLEAYAQEIEARADRLVEAAHQETAYTVSPRLKDVELPRTTNQLRLAAKAARSGSWKQATIDTGSNIRSELGPLGPVVVFGPNNFPFAFNGISGGDFAAAVAAGNPVIAKAHPAHPTTTAIFAEAVLEALRKTDMPAGFVQLLYQMDHEDGKKLVAHSLIGATAFTGSRTGGLALKEAADKAGNPIYLELSSINPVFILEGALVERGSDIADEFVTSCLMGTGQFCTNPGLIVLPKSPAADTFITQVTDKFKSAPAGALLAANVKKSLLGALDQLKQAGAKVLTGGCASESEGYRCENTLMKVSGSEFLSNVHRLQAEAFGNASLIVVAEDMSQMVDIAAALEGNLTGCFYTDTTGKDDAAYDQVAPVLRQKVGRLLNDKMPTGVAVVSSMNHGGPYPATGHPGFTSVGIPASIIRFGMLQSYDNVRPHRLPASLQDRNPTGEMWRLIDGTWTQKDVG